jgi:hypothetical protein
MREAGAPLEYSDARAMHIYAHDLQRIISGCNYLQPFVFVMNILVRQCMHLVVSLHLYSPTSFAEVQAQKFISSNTILAAQCLRQLVHRNEILHLL